LEFLVEKVERLVAYVPEVARMWSWLVAHAGTIRLVAAVAGMLWIVWTLWRDTRLRLYFNRDDPRCSRLDHATRFYSVGIVNASGVREERVSVAVEAVEPASVKLPVHRQLPFSGTQERVSHVPPSEGGSPTRFVDVVAVTVTKEPRNWLCLGDGVDVDEHALIEVTLRIEARMAGKPLRLKFERLIVTIEGLEALGPQWAPDLRPAPY